MGAPRNSRLWGGGETHRGHVREDNQDVIIVEPNLGLSAVLDGMGGANAGDVAARMAAEEIVTCVSCLPGGSIHTFASHLVMRGVALKAVQELLGHANIHMTMRYAHLAPQIARDAVRLLDRPVNPEGSANVPESSANAA